MSCKLPFSKAFRMVAPLLAVLALAGCPPETPPPSKPLPLFSATPVRGVAPLEVSFTDESIPGTSPITLWQWDFGDGTTSEEANPKHTYTKQGLYSVTLTVASVVGVDRLSKINLINVQGEAGPDADFNAPTRQGAAPLTVKFTDTSKAGSREITSWLWKFGDGTTSTEQNPSHTYAQLGAFDVSLTVETELGEDTLKRTGYVVVSGKDLAFGGASADRAFGLAATEDGRYVLAGDTESPEDGSRDLSLVITDKFGNAASEKRFGGEDDESAAGLVAAGDGGYFIGGTVDFAAGGSDAVLVRTDSNGNRVWSQIYGGADDERVENIAATPDGGVLLVGSLRKNTISTLFQWAARIDRDGTALWIRSFSSGRFTAAVANGSVFALGTVTTLGEDGSVALMDGVGTVTKLVHFPPRTFTVDAIAVLPQGDGYVIAGSGTEADGEVPHAWVGAIDVVGALQWSYKTESDKSTAANAITVTADGGVVVAGSALNATDNRDDAYLLSLTADGEFAWKATYGGKNTDRAYAVVVEEDGFAIAGTTESFGPTGTNMYLVKTDAAGVQQTFPLTGRGE